jgi:uncharacterized protein (DUF2062 family)
MIHGFFQRRVVRPIVNLLTQGITPEKIAMSLACGIVLGIFPALGWTTLLCALAAFAFRLNLPAIQLVNYFVYPLQLALLIPFIRMGEFVFRAQRMALSLSQIAAMIRADMLNAIRVLWVATLHAVMVWAVLAGPAIFLLYIALAPVLRKLAKATGLLPGARGSATGAAITSVAPAPSHRAKE